MKAIINLVMTSIIATQAAGLAFAANSNPSTTGSQENVCSVLATGDAPVGFKTVVPFQDTLTDVEKGMIQLAVLITDPSTPVTPEQALEIFSDLHNDFSLRGDIVYFNVGSKTYAYVTWFPGDNTYGAVFRIFTYDNGTVSANLVAKITDSDAYCLIAQ
jgi:hypothetical protein